MRHRVDELVDEMLDKGILYEDARYVFERRFLTRALARSKGTLGSLAERLGIHRNTLARKITNHGLKRRN